MRAKQDMDLESNAARMWSWGYWTSRYVMPSEVMLYLDRKNLLSPELRAEGLRFLGHADGWKGTKHPFGNTILDMSSSTYRDYL